MWLDESEFGINLSISSKNKSFLTITVRVGLVPYAQDRLLDYGWKRFQNYLDLKARPNNYAKD